jgi:hypothetical protein
LVRNERLLRKLLSDQVFLGSIAIYLKFTSKEKITGVEDKLFLEDINDFIIRRRPHQCPERNRQAQEFVKASNWARNK